MRKELVFRVEHAESRKGIYWHGSSISSQLNELEGNHPQPSDDPKIGDIWTVLREPYDFWNGGNVRDNPWLFGFASIEQLRHWLYKHEWLETLTAEGFVLAIYQCGQHHIGDTQAVFHKEHAVRVGEATLI